MSGCPLIVSILTTTGSYSSDVKGGRVISFGVGAGEGLAAVGGHQSGDEGAWAAMPASSLGDRSDHGSFDSAFRHQLILVNRL